MTTLHGLLQNKFKIVRFQDFSGWILEVGRLSDFQKLVEETETAEVRGGALDAACEKLMHLVESTGASELYYVGKGLLVSSSCPALIVHMFNTWALRALHTRIIGEL